MTANVTAVMIVRDARDTVRACVLHHLALGVDRVLVTDNGSSDGTSAILRRLARRHPVSVTRSDGPFLQEAMVQRMVATAVADGADWIVPVDSDEFWAPTGSLHDVLAAVPPEVDALSCPVANFVQRRDRIECAEEGLLTMTLRTTPIDPPADARARVEAGVTPFVAAPFPEKCVARAHPGLGFTTGAHGLHAAGAVITHARDLVLLHAPLRARDQLVVRAEHGRRLAEVLPDPELGWQSRRWHAISRQGRAALHREWDVNSHEDGVLGDGDHPHRLVEDHRLRDAVAPWVRERSRARPRARLSTV